MPKAAWLVSGLTALVVLVAAAAQLPLLPLAQADESQDIQALIQKGQHSEALAKIDAALASSPADHAMRFRKGVVLSLMDRKAEALTTFQKLSEDVPNSPTPLNNMAAILASQGEFDKARSVLEKAIRTNPAYGTAYQNLGDVYAQLASQAYTKALQIDANDTKVKPKLALLRELNASAADVMAGTRPTPNTNAAPSAAAAKPVPAKPDVSKPDAAKPAAPGAVPAEAPAKPGAAVEPANAQRDLQAAVQAWASAWSGKNFDAYVAAYDSNFKGSYDSHSAWREERKARIMTKNRISVTVSGIQVKAGGDGGASASFVQNYSSGELNSNVSKTLKFKQENGRWVITQESGR